MFIKFVTKIHKKIKNIRMENSAAKNCPKMLVSYFKKIKNIFEIGR